ncbi:MAG: HAMP domain-containing protein [Rhodothermia bacterium]|nr:HAMP domain-containing protein [Rhodothermia bacterium]
METRKLEAIGNAFSEVQKDVDAIQVDLVAFARRLAADPVIVSELAEWESGEQSADDLVHLMARQQLPDRVSVEVYSPTPQLVAWNGFSMPLDEGPSRSGFLEGLLTGVVSDGSERQGVAVWWPVRAGQRIVGAIRAIELLELQMPVENEYLKSYSRARIWSRKAGLPVEVVFDAPFDDELPPEGEVRLLTGLDGTTLGRVFIERPADAEVIGRIRSDYDHILSFWFTLILAWLAAGTWIYYSRTARSVGVLLARFLLFALVWWSVRYLLIAVDVPARFQPGRAPLSPLFDPVHLASSAAFGLLRSSGDLLISAGFAFVFGLAVVHFARRLRRMYLVQSEGVSLPRLALSGRVWLFAAILGAVSVGLSALLAELSRVTILDSTLDYFARSGLLPGRLVLVVFSGLLIFTIAFVVLGTALVGLGARVLRNERRSVDRSSLAAGGIASIVVTTVAFWAFGLDTFVPLPVVMMFGAAIMTGAVVELVRFRDRAGLLTLRNVLPSIFVLTVILYPLFYRGMEVQRSIRMVDAAESFNDREDPRVIYGMEQVLRDAARNDVLAGRLESRAPDEGARGNEVVDSLAVAILGNSFLASLGSYDVSITVYRAPDHPVGRYYEIEPSLSPSTLEDFERSDIRLLKGMQSESRDPGPMVEELTGSQLTGESPYRGLIGIESPSADSVAGWVVVRAEPRTLIQEAATPFPRVLVPAGFYGNLHSSLTVAVFRNEALVRSTGDEFGRYRLPEEVALRLPSRREIWIRDDVRGRSYQAYYRLQEDSDPVYDAPAQSVIAVRTPSISVFDHLYNLLRLTLGGLIVGLPIYIGGLLVRRRRGLLPAERVRFRDKILNAFFGVGVVTVAAMGVVGLNVVTAENEREVESWLRQHLDRIERTVALDSRGGEMAYQVLDRIRIDSLAARVGLDINLYKDNQVVASSRPQLVEDRLIDPRLPISAHEALFIDGLTFAKSEERLGRFSYMAGFRAIPDEVGRPHYVISIPTLPEQERIEEERARTVAYLFGALLLLVLVVMITASLLANALTRPIARLREGIEAVSRGRFSRIRPLDTRDEIGELVDSFNTMQDQLSESRRRLAQQERQLAWREMARQVAHEIKNPLTPMKLSVQHLRRSFDSRRESIGRDFADLFDRITSTLTEQIDALARIANEFSSFARMPQRIEEILDLNAVVAEAVTLMEAEAKFDIDTDLQDVTLPVRADREEVRRIYINLIKNAIQSIPETREGRISIRTRLETAGDGVARWAYSSISDNGAGIPEELQGKIFVPNFSTKTSGTGLGLAIVRKSVEDLHGEIGFETGEDSGTKFWVRLPLEVEVEEESPA